MPSPKNPVSENIEETGLSPARNLGTMVRVGRTDPVPRAPAAAPPSAHDAFILAYPRIVELSRLEAASRGVVIAATRRDRLVDARLIAPRHALIVGRHTQCGLRLDAPSVSLRHLAVLVVDEADSPRPLVRLWDLNTYQPFTTEDGIVNVAVAADGPLFFSLDEYGLWLVPARAPIEGSWPESAEAAWATLPPRQFIHRQAAGAAGAEHAALRRQAFLHATITALGPPLRLNQDDDLEPAWGEIRMTVGHFKERRTVSAERLAQGVLIGRYDRCAVPVDRDAGELSRVHLLLVRIGEEVWAIDTASTNGVWRRDTPIEAEVLDDNDDLALGTSAQVNWHRLKYAAS